MKIGARQYAQGLLAACDGKTDEQVTSIIDAFAKKMVAGGNKKQLQSVISKVEKLQEEREGKIKVAVTHMPGVGTGISDYIRKAVERSKGKAQVSTTEDEALIGGVIINIGDKVIDASLKGRLQQLKYHLLSE